MFFFVRSIATSKGSKTKKHKKMIYNTTHPVTGEFTQKIENDLVWYFESQSDYLPTRAIEYLHDLGVHIAENEEIEEAIRIIINTLAIDVEEMPVSDEGATFADLAKIRALELKAAQQIAELFK